MTTTHELEDAATSVLREAMSLLGPSGPSDIPSAVAAVTCDPLSRIVAERVLERAGFDVLWHDLAGPGWEEAKEGIGAVASQPIVLTQLYGKNAHAVAGILRACVVADSSRIRSVGYHVRYDAMLLETAFNAAAALDCDRMLADTLSDVHFAAHKEDVTTPAAVQNHLRGVRGFELAACYYVLEGAGQRFGDDMMHAYLDPVLRTFFPGGRVG